MSYIKNGCEIFTDIISDKTILSKILDEWELALKLDGFDFKKSKYSSEALVSMWTHVKGERKKLLPLKHLKSAVEILKSFYIKDIFAKIVPNAKKITLLETIIFNKPPQDGGDLHWHQDTSFFPLKPMTENKNWFITLWIPLDDVNEENGAMQYVKESFNFGELASVDLHSGKQYNSKDNRKSISDILINMDDVITGNSSPGDVLVHNGLTLHRSLPNISINRNRRALAFKFLIDDVLIDYKDGTSDIFVGERDFVNGELLKSICFPEIQFNP